MPRIRNHTSRRAPPLKDSDYDHEICLVDDERDEQAPEHGWPAPSLTVTVPEALAPTHSGSSSAALPLLPGRPASADTRRDHVVPVASNTSDVVTQQPAPAPALGRPSCDGPSVIDVLYENERGLFLCGVPLFSHAALGNLDPSPWTNAANKTSPTDIHTAQVPDPSWHWVWPAWRINHDVGADADGWEYSFMFAKAFAWHGPTWYSSFVRRRTWIRKRAKVWPASLAAAATATVAAVAGEAAEGEAAAVHDPHLLNPDYFLVLPAAEMRRSSSRATRASRTSRRRASCDSVGGGGDGADALPALPPAMDSADALLQFLRSARIDREKIEAVDRFLGQGGEDLVRLQDVMHDVMAQFVFQASRRTLLTRLTEAHTAAVATREQAEADTREADGAGPVHRLQALGRRAGYLAAAVRHADEEVRRLEYWSDVKAMARSGDAAGAVDDGAGWPPHQWQGVDSSGPAGPPQEPAPAQPTVPAKAG